MAGPLVAELLNEGRLRICYFEHGVSQSVCGKWVSVSRVQNQ